MCNLALQAGPILTDTRSGVTDGAGTNATPVTYLFWRDSDNVGFAISEARMAFQPEDPEFKRSARLASAFANKAFITIHEGMVRISFGEAAAGAGETVYHTAVSLSVVDALSIADTIYSVYDQAYPLPSTAAAAYGSEPPPAKDTPSGG